MSWLRRRVWSVECGVWKKSFFPIRILTLYTLYSTLLICFSSCGFQPVYGTKSALPANSPVLAGVVIVASDSGSTTSVLASSSDTSNNSANRISRQFSQNLEDLLVPSTKTTAPLYRLEVSLSQTNTGIGISRDGTASRYNLTINSGYKLTRISDGKLIDNGAISSVTSYNNPSNQYFSTYISEQDARKRGTAELAERYLQRLSAITEKTKPTEPVAIQPTIMPIQITPNENRPQIN